MAQVRGAFPYPSAQAAEGGGVIALPTGGVWYPPSGEWLMTLPANMVLQYWNPLANSWQTISNASDYVSSDGFNLRVLNTTGTITVAPTAVGSGGTNGIGFAQTGAAIGIAASPQTGAGSNATAYAIVGGTVAAPTITQAGSGFAVPPLVVIDPPPAGGIQATAIATLTAGGGIASIVMVNAGAGYAASPNFYLIPQTAVYQGAPSGGNAAGSIPAPGLVFPTNAVPGNQNTSPVGAQLTSVALTGSGTLTGVVMINSGEGYVTTPPAVTVTGVGAATATATLGPAPATLTAFFQPRVQ